MIKKMKTYIYPVEILKKFRRKILNIKLKPRKWSDIEYFDEKWKTRIQKMSELIEKEKTILDLGCGKMWLKDFLGNDVKYFGVDYIKRSEDCIVCNFNNYEFPEIQAELCFISGTLEYINDLNWFVAQISKNCDAVILSYCIKDLSPEIRARKHLGWVNHLTSKELVNIFNSHGFIIQKNSQKLGVTEIFKFIKK